MPHPLQQASTLYNHLKVQLLQAFPELEHDERALLDTMEGLSDFNELIAAVVRSVLDDAMLTYALAQRITTLNERMKRLEHRIQAKRQLVAQVMAEIGVTKIVSDDFTVSQGYTQPKVVITDETQLPSFCWRERVIREPDKAVIKDALADKQLSVPGATLSNPQPMLVVRTN